MLPILDSATAHNCAQLVKKTTKKKAVFTMNLPNGETKNLLCIITKKAERNKLAKDIMKIPNHLNETGSVFMSVV